MNKYCKHILLVVLLSLFLTLPCSTKEKKGKLLWSKKVPGYTTELTVYKDKLLFGTISYSSDAFYCMDTKTGKQLWKYNGYFADVKAIIDDNAAIISEGNQGVLYAKQTAGHVGSQINAALTKIDLATGKVLWRFKAHISKPGRFISSTILNEPLIAGDVIYFGVYELDLSENRSEFADFYYRFYALDKNSGKKIWQYDVKEIAHFAMIPDMYYMKFALSSGPTPFGKNINTVAVSKNKVYFGFINGEVYCLNRTTGKKEWTFETKDFAANSVIVMNNTLTIFSLDWKVYNLDADTGKVLWEYAAGFDTSFVRPVNDRGIFYFSAGEYGHYSTTPEQPGFRWRKGFVYAVDQKSGKELWAMKVTEMPLGTIDRGNDLLVPMVDGDMVYYSKNKGKIVHTYNLQIPNQVIPVIRDQVLYTSSGPSRYGKSINNSRTFPEDSLYEEYNKDFVSIVRAWEFK